MKHMMFVYTDDSPELDLREQVAQLPGVEMVYEFAGPASEHGEYPDLMAVINDRPDLVQEAIEALAAGVRTYIRAIWAEQPHIITPQDIPGGPVVRPAKLKVARPLITSEDIPGPRPQPQSIKDFSAAPGLPSFQLAGIGIGGLHRLGELGD